MILVTGATGYVANLLVPMLLEDGQEVRVGVRPAARGKLAQRVDMGGAECVDLDVDNPDSLTSAMEGCDTLFLLTRLATDQIAEEHALINAAKDMGVSTIVKQSIMGVDFEDGFELRRRHREIERYIRKLNFQWTCIRPAPMMQDFITYSAAAIRQENAIFRPEGEGRMAFVDARDVAAVAAHVLNTGDFGGEALTVTGPEALTNYEVAGLFSRSLGRDIRYVDIIEEEFANVMRAEHGEGLNTHALAALLELHQLNKKGEAANVADTVEAVTGRPPIFFAQFIDDYREAFEQPAEPWTAQDEGFRPGEAP